MRVPGSVKSHVPASHRDGRISRTRDVQVRAMAVVRVGEVGDTAKHLQHHERHQQQGDTATQTSLEGAAEL